MAALTDRGVDPGDIDQIRVRAPLVSVAMEGLSRPYRGDRLHPVNVTFSVPYTLAVYLVAGEVTPRQLTPGYIERNRAELDAMADRITLDHDWSLTADVLAGLGAGVDYGPLLRDRGPVASLRALRQVGETHDSIDTVREVAGLLRSGETRAVLDALRSPLDWERFDAGNARFDNLEFAFGAVIEARVDGERYRVRADEHAGACGRPLSETTATVRRRFEREAGAGFDCVCQAHEQGLSALTRFLSAPGGGTVTER
ncbi:MAG: hypothetical protein J07HX64_02743 [halophilic archaeon J07HX64]|nr:MAG: hypothetical protein J07HX64_02743 [halophilic archaeon J07HX64]